MRCGPDTRENRQGDTGVKGSLSTDQGGGCGLSTVTTRLHGKDRRTGLYRPEVDLRGQVSYVGPWSLDGPHPTLR